MISIVMPCYNEGQIIESAVREWQSEVISRIPGAELVVVDDCSTDETGEILDRLCVQFPAVRHVRMERNGGHGRALRCGFRHVSPNSEFVFQTDSDRQHRPGDFWNLWELRQAYDFVFGVRSHRRDGSLRVVITRLMRLLIASLWGVWIRDANCPFKLMRTAALNQVLASVPEDSFIPMVMVSIAARKMAFRCIEVPVIHLPRTGGTQSLRGLPTWLRVSYRCSKQLWELRRTLVRLPSHARLRADSI